MGPRYILDHCLDAYRQEQEEKQYRAYIADGVKAISENTANYAGGSYLTSRWVDMNKEAIEPEEVEEPEKVVNERLARFGITVIDD